MYHIGEFAKKTGLTPRALRLYEARGLIQSQRNLDNQYRCYSQADYQRVMQIQVFRRLGFSLAELERILPALGQANARQELTELLSTRLTDSRRQISVLQKQQAELQSLLALLQKTDAFSEELLRQLQPIHSPQRRLLMQLLDSLELTMTGPRPENEDQTLVFQSPEGGLFMVADGTGGSYASTHAAGWLRQHLDLSRVTPKTYASYFANLLERLNAELYQTQTETSKRSATCLSLLVLRQGYAFIAHVGDTRIYQLYQGQLTQLTRDHTPIQRLLDRGELLQKEIPTHPQRHLVTSILGYAPALGEIFTDCQPALPGSLYLLVSDGVTRILSDQEIKDLLLQNALPEVLAKFRSLSEKHGEDNASIVVVPLA